MLRERIKLFCFPYAGGSSFIYNEWRKFFDDDIEIIAVELQGRGKRITEPLYKDLDHVIEDMFLILKEQIDGAPYMFFGHSMGAMIAYELCQRLLEENRSLPEHVFFSGRGAPHILREDKEKFHMMSDEKFKEEVLSLGGTPPEIFSHPELLEFYLPILRSDFEIAESDISREIINPLPFDITVFLGKEEDITASQACGWKEHTTKSCTISYLNGEHFFLHDHVKTIAERVNSIVCKTIVK